MVEQRFCKAKAIGSNPLAGFQLDPALGNQFLPKLRLAATALKRSWLLAASALKGKWQSRPTVKHCRHSQSRSRNCSRSRHRRKFEAKCFSPSSSP